VDSGFLVLVREGVLLVFAFTASLLAAALAIGTLTGVLQAATQVQEQSLGVVPRLVAVLAALGLCGPWMGAQALRFAAACLELAARGSP